MFGTSPVPLASEPGVSKCCVSMSKSGLERRRLAARIYHPAKNQTWLSAADVRDRHKVVRQEGIRRNVIIRSLRLCHCLDGMLELGNQHPEVLRGRFSHLLA